MANLTNLEPLVISVTLLPLKQRNIDQVRNQYAPKNGASIFIKSPKINYWYLNQNSYNPNTPQDNK